LLDDGDDFLFDEFARGLADELLVVAEERVEVDVIHVGKGHGASRAPAERMVRDGSLARGSVRRQIEKAEKRKAKSEERKVKNGCAEPANDRVIAREGEAEPQRIELRAARRQHRLKACATFGAFAVVDRARGGCYKNRSAWSSRIAQRRAPLLCTRQFCGLGPGSTDRSGVLSRTIWG